MFWSTMFRILQSVAFVAIAIVAWNFAEGYRYGDARVYDWSRPGIEAQFPDGTTKSTVFARLGKASTESQENDVVRWEYTGHSLGLALPFSRTVVPPSTRSLVLVFNAQGRLTERLYTN
jgi:hypothetical protein